ncbi:MAG TPA: Calx-beta domain-containing protein [Gammaproteobacteria bacterium]|nr:Calx-beta domain-containing protein [Gammaproteobacteria bacterium]
MTKNEPVGLWMLPAHVGRSRSALATLQRDFARLRTLEHPHIARMLELGCNGQQYYVTGERLDGEPLREVLTHLAPEHLEVGEADEIVRAIGSALVYSHEQGVSHGDVRAENVLVTMDRRFMLTNFLARRVARISARPPQPSDDLAGLARLAAELYTGSTSPHAVRSAAHGSVPAARLNAIRTVLEVSPNRRPASVAQFLAAAGLAYPAATVVAVRQPTVRQQRSWSLWRFVLPVGAAIGLGTLVAAYHDAGGNVRDSAVELQRRGLEALNAVASRVKPPASASASEQSTASERLPASERPAAAGERASPPPTEPAPSAGAAPHATEPPATSSAAAASARPTPTETVVDPPVGSLPAGQPAAAPVPPAEAAAAPAPTTTAAVRRGDPAVLSLGAPKVAAREDHSVVAIDVVRSGDTTHETDVGWWTSPGTAYENDDYAGGRRMVTFPAGATVERLLIPIVNDGVREPDEVFTVHLSRPRNGVTGTVTATRVTLYDDD